MAENTQHGPSSPDEINPKIASDVQYWSKEFNVSGEALHEAIRVHGTSVPTVQEALAIHHGSGAQHEKKGR